ncbi:MAG: diguanylate cyclase [Actinomycetota bacterium]|nr:diguanylate cyclase [Actinomycetota bacterium]
MAWQNLNFIIPLAAVVLMSIPGIIYIWTHRKGIQDIIGIVIITLSLIWIVSFMFEQGAATGHLKVLFDKIKYTGSILLPLALFLLAAKYCNYNKLFKLKYLIPISALPVITLFLVFTNELHRLIWVDANLVLSDSFSLIVKEYNTLYFIFIIYSTLLILSGVIMTLTSIIKSSVRQNGQNRWKKIFLIPYMSIPGIIILAKYIGFNPFPYINETPIIIAVFTVSIIPFLNKSRIKEIMPVAFETVFENMDDGLILTDANENVLKLNPASQKIFDTMVDRAVGKPFMHLLPGIDIDNYSRALQGKNDLKIGNNGDQSYFDIKRTEIKNSKGKPLGKVTVLRNITDIRKAEEDIKYLSFYDKLSGVYNRAFFDNELERLNSSRQMPLSMVIADVNGLKIINDAFGHLRGDELIKKIASILKTCFRKEDIIARWGGDEFSILLPKTSHATTMKIIKRVHDKCREHSTDTMLISLSTGVATINKPSENTDDLLIEAEDRMYRHKLMENQSARSSIINSLEKALEARDYETEEHGKRLKKYSLLFGHVLNLPDTKLDELGLLSALHDIGKIEIPDSIVLKTGKLNKEEWKIMKKHPEIGYRIALSSPDLAHIAKSILYHHERWDGKGYPYGLEGKDIPITSRVISVVDAYDAMTSDRPYRKALPKEEAIEELKRCSGSQFDPELIGIFMDQLAPKALVS